MTKRLVGSDGQLVIGVWGTPLVAADTLQAGVWYLVTGIDGTLSVFPTGAMVGYMYKADGTETLATDDTAEPWEGTPMCDIQSWTLDFTKAEANVTAFCDNVNVYRSGKTDATGGIEGVFSSGLTSIPGGFQNQFVTVVHQDGSLVDPADYTISIAQGATIFAQLYTDSTEVSGEAEGFYWVPVSLTGFSASAGGEDAQTFSSPFRIAPDDKAQFAYYEYVNQ